MNRDFHSPWMDFSPQQAQERTAETAESAPFPPLDGFGGLDPGDGESKSPLRPVPRPSQPCQCGSVEFWISISLEGEPQCWRCNAAPNQTGIVTIIARSIHRGV